MADEIQINVSAVLTNGFLSDLFKPGNISVDQTTLGKGGHAQIIGMSSEVVDVGDATNGWCFLRNTDDENFVTYGPERYSGTIEIMEPFGKMKPGEWGAFRLDTGVVLRAQADTAECVVDVHVWND